MSRGQKTFGIILMIATWLNLLAAANTLIARRQFRTDREFEARTLSLIAVRLGIPSTQPSH